MPAHGGCFINPYDNKFHAALRQHYYSKQRSTIGNMLTAIITAFEEMPEETIRSYFDLCGYTGGQKKTHHYFQELMSEGFRDSGEHAEVHAHCEHYYASWKRGLRLIRDDNTIACSVVADGHEWHLHSCKLKEGSAK